MRSSLPMDPVVTSTSYQQNDCQLSQWGMQESATDRPTHPLFTSQHPTIQTNIASYSNQYYPAQPAVGLGDPASQTNTPTTANNNFPYLQQFPTDYYSRMNFGNNTAPTTNSSQPAVHRQSSYGASEDATTASHVSYAAPVKTSPSPHDSPPTPSHDSSLPSFKKTVQRIFSLPQDVQTKLEYQQMQLAFKQQTQQPQIPSPNRHPSATLMTQPLFPANAMYSPYYQPNPTGQFPNVMAPYTPPKKQFSFVAMSAVKTKKRFRRKFEEIDRIFACNYPGCDKSYGTLNNLNAHILMQKHGNKRSAYEFKDHQRGGQAQLSQIHHQMHHQQLPQQHDLQDAYMLPQAYQPHQLTSQHLMGRDTPMN